MAGKRGIVNVCQEEGCGWQGEKGQALNHYCKKHCTAETAPFGCTVCQYATDIFSSLERHRETARHIKLSKGSDEKYLKRQGNEQDIMKKFSKLSPEDSKTYWDSKKEKPDPKHPSPPITEKPIKDREIAAQTETEAAVKAIMPSVPKISTPECEPTKSGEEKREKRDKSVDSVRSISSSSSSSSSSTSSSSSPGSVAAPIRKVIISKKRQASRSRSPQYRDWKRKNTTETTDKGTFDVMSEVDRQPDPDIDNNTTLAAIRDLKDSVQDNPAILSAGIFGLSRQLQIQTNESIQISSKLDTVVEHLADIKKLLSTMVTQHSDNKKEMTATRQTLCLQQNTAADNNKSIGNLATTVKALTPRLESMMGSVTTALSTFAAAQTASLRSTTRPTTEVKTNEILTKATTKNSINNDRLRDEFEKDWEKERNDSPQGRHANNFRAPYPPRSTYRYGGHYKNLGRKSVERSINTLRKSKDRRH